ncbi:UNVERIFIED_CONTAM: hypothetical protein Sangu_3097900 [Sesamum angustifolium]|uniref:Uncharacterized protein n=1 Tax=Sesamum angustifolium TaxID=2727405 RepID=A0AAW2K735_9LAMI
MTQPPLAVIFGNSRGAAICWKFIRYHGFGEGDSLSLIFRALQSGIGRPGGPFEGTPVFRATAGGSPVEPIEGIPVLQL